MPAAIDVTLPLPGVSPVAGKATIARFDDGSLSSDGGLLALREVTRASASPGVSPPALTTRARPSASSMASPRCCASAC